jgi:hypothetical protein
LAIAGTDYLIYLVWAKVEINDLALQTIFLRQIPMAWKKLNPVFT